MMEIDYMYAEGLLYAFLFGFTVGLLVCLFFSAWVSNKIDQQRVAERLISHKGKVFRLVEVGLDGK